MLPQYVRDNRGQIAEDGRRSAFQMAFDSEFSRQSSSFSFFPPRDAVLKSIADEHFYQYLRSTDLIRGERFDKGLQRHARGAAQLSRYRRAQVLENLPRH